MIRPKILHVEGSSKFGGDSVLILELGRAAREQGFDVDVLATDQHFAGMVVEAGLGLVNMDVIRREIRPLWDARGLVRLTSFLKQSDYSIVHTHTSKPGIVGRRAARWARVPGILHTVHLFPFHEETGRAPKAAYVAAERLAAHWCDRIITVSDYFRDWALGLGIGRPEQIVSIANGAPEQRATPSRRPAEIRAELGLDGAFVLLSTGRLVEQKGLEYLIRAMAQVRRDVPSARVLLAGDGPLRGSLEQLARELGVDDVVTFLGFRPDVADLLAAADLVALPSLWEGLSISLLEAMAAGKPVLTTTIGGNREATGDGATAVLVPPKDADALAGAIRELAAAPGRLEELGRAGRALQRERYTMSRMLDSYLTEYTDLIQTKSSRRAGAPVRIERSSDALS